MINKKLFALFVDNSCKDMNLYNSVIELIQESIIDARGVESCKHYELLTKLMNNENNAGWEDRHSDRIEILRIATGNLIDDYEKYLP